MKSFIVNENDAGQRLDRFVLKTCPSLPSALMYRYIRTKRIKLNGKKAEIAVRLNPGDVVDFYINDEFFLQDEYKYSFMSTEVKPDIIYEDENILLLNKDAGLLCHPDDREFSNTLIAGVQKYLYEKGEYKPESEASFSPALVNRIDRNTAGIVIAAKNAQALRILNSKMKARQIRRFYLCAVQGRPPEADGLLTAWLLKDEDKNTVKIYDSPQPDAKDIVTKYRVLKSEAGLSLLEVELITGRSHQIRAQFAHAGFPLSGDVKYGTTGENARKYKTQLLCSYRLIFDFTEDSGILNYLTGQEFSITDVWFAKDFPKNIL